jgi:hypothetical protein
VTQTVYWIGELRQFPSLISWLASSICTQAQCNTTCRRAACDFGHLTSPQRMRRPADPHTVIPRFGGAPMYASPCTRPGRQFDALSLGLGKGAFKHHHSKRTPTLAICMDRSSSTVPYGQLAILPAMLRVLQHGNRALSRLIALITSTGSPLTRPVIYPHRQPSVELGTGRSSCTSTTLVAVADPDHTTEDSRGLRLNLRPFLRKCDVATTCHMLPGVEDHQQPTRALCVRSGSLQHTST